MLSSYCLSCLMLCGPSQVLLQFLQLAAQHSNSSMSPIGEDTIAPQPSGETPATPSSLRPRRLHPTYGSGLKPLDVPWLAGPAGAREHPLRPITTVIAPTLAVLHYFAHCFQFPFKLHLHNLPQLQSLF